MATNNELAALDRLANSHFHRGYADLDPAIQLILLDMVAKNKPSRRRANSSRNWWCRLILDSLDDWVGPDQAAQGRSMYRKGQVGSKIKVTKQTITGRVRSSQGRSHAVVIDFSEKVESSMEALAHAIATDPAMYLEFSEGRLGQGLAEVPLMDGSSFSESIWIEGDCSCWYWEPCKHIVALANAAADLFERDFRAGLLFLGIEYDLLSRKVMEFRRASGGDEGLAVPTHAYDDFGWPVIEDHKGTTSLKRFGRYVQPAGELAQMRSRRVDAAAQLPKNRIIGMNGSMSGIFSDLYQALDFENGGSQVW